MKHELARYNAYKDSGVEWIGKTPKHWGMIRLKELATIQNSNVDKKSHENEISVRLCNYVDVYKNEFISSSQDFMQATANKSEIKRFSIKKCDVLITKDSETCDDIAVPALATESIEGVLCGYHLAQFRTKQKMLLGSYLFRLFQSISYGFRFVISAKGITRVGLGQSAIADSLTPVPPLSEQKAIADYLDTKTVQIDRKINLLTQKVTQYGKFKQSLINETVTRGLDKTVAMKDSGVEWIGEIPKHWKVKRLKEVFVESKAKSTTGDETLLSVSEYTGVTQKQDNVGEDEFVSRAESLVGYKICKVGDLIINIMLAWKRGLGVSSFYGIVSPSYAVYTPSKEVSSPFFHYLLRTEDAIAEFKRNSTGIIESRLRLYTDSFYALSIAVPSFKEQQSIADYLDTKTAHIDRIVATINTQIEKLKELRKTLINDVVTGKIKVA